jgi:hypothetical protein
MKNKVQWLGALMACVLSLQIGTQAKDFSNLDFEDAIQPLVNEGSSGVSVTNALPGWTSYSDDIRCDRILYNTMTLGGGSIDLFGPGSLAPILHGDYMVVMQGPGYVLGGSFALGQTGQIPVESKSLQFWSVSPVGIKVSFNKQLLQYIPIENDANYTVYGVDISQFAGQTGELLFTAPPQTGATIDNIQFSSEPLIVPEPGTLTLFAMGAFALAGTRARQLVLRRLAQNQGC